MRGRRIPLPLPNTGSMHRKTNSYYMRGIILISLVLFILLHVVFNFTEIREPVIAESTNDSTAAIMSMVPSVLHKFLTPRSRNQTFLSGGLIHNGTWPGYISGVYVDAYQPPNITEIKRRIARYNEMQMVLNEDTFGPLQNDSVIIVIQVHTRVTYLRHLIVSLAQARDISKTLLIFSHDFYDEDINDLVQTIDFCKVMQIFYPFSIQTHPYVYPGVDPNDCPRDIKRDQAIIRKCNNAMHPDLYGHYREAAFTQTKHHWWWKANRVFDQLDVTRYHKGLVLFLEEDHYVAEDFLYLLKMMEERTKDLCPQCNILSLGTYLKTFNYYTYNSKTNTKSFSGQYASSALISSNNLGLLGYNKNRNSLQFSSSSSLSSSSYYNKLESHYTENNFDSKKYVGDTNTYTNANNLNTITNANTHPTEKSSSAQQTWSYHVLPSLYSVYQKVVVAFIPELLH